MVETINVPLRFFIAGPYCPRDCSLHQAAQVAQHNVNRAIEVAVALIKKGHYVFVPHMSHYIHTSPYCNEDFPDWWYEEDNTFIDHWATALFYIAHSLGAYNEFLRAQHLGLPIYKDLDEVPIVNKRETEG